MNKKSFLLSCVAFALLGLSMVKRSNGFDPISIDPLMVWRGQIAPIPWKLKIKTILFVEYVLRYINIQLMKSRFKSINIVFV